MVRNTPVDTCLSPFAGLTAFELYTLEYFVQIEKLEGADDLEIYLQKGYGQSINYKMGTQLLKDVFQTMERAILADRKFLEQSPSHFQQSTNMLKLNTLYN